MSSNINPNDIDATYPIAGQDNDSQGFRDNFTNIKTNFQYAEDEITDLQNKVILKKLLILTSEKNYLMEKLKKLKKTTGLVLVLLVRMKMTKTI